MDRDDAFLPALRRQLPRMFAAALLLVPAAAQVPKLPGTPAASQDSPSAGAKAAPESLEQAKQRISKSLTTTRQQLAELDSATQEELPKGITPAEVAARRSDLVRTAFSLERHLKTLESAKVLAESADEAQRREREWSGFKEGPPYSFLFFDELRNQYDAASAKVAAFESSVALVERQIAAQQDEYRKAEEANRRAADEVARAKGSPGEAAALWRLDSSSIQLRSVGASLALYQAGIVTHQPRIAAAKAELALLKRQLAAIGDAVSFTDEDLEKAKASAAAKTAAIEKEVSSLAKHQASVLTERDRARTALEELRKQAESDPSQPNPASEAAEARLRAVEADAEALAFQTETLGFSIRVSGDVPDALTLRRQLLAPQDADQRLAARQQLQAMTERARAWVTFIANERAAVGAAIREQESRLVAIPDEDPRHPNEQRVLAAQLRKTECLERLDQLANVTLHSFERWLADDERHLRERPLGTWLADSSARLWGVARRVWGFEIYRYEDKVEVDGETITVKRGLTLGWLLGALLFFFTAYRAASWFSRRIQRTVVQHSLAGEAQARTLRRWAMLAVGVLLALITLHLLRIPVTAFAFLGGALAIGIGFGTQTFFKNFISGIIVLAERKVKVGDILDVDGVIGTVTAVDTRSSTIRSVDGMETLVPNSMLLENKVTNWTHTSARQRRVLRVGVAYGSPVQQVSEILAECAQRHGLVLDDPPPQVLFEDFGADSLVFALYFWVVLSERSSGNVVASDLRFMLDKRFAEAGIAIAYPQRDIHLNALAPLQVELVHGTKEPAAPEARPD